ncbi:MAG TPA: DNA repair protein RecO [Fimbriimonadales bacterium]|nr:DNA repair protein RecO [Fimbriimonadales bacterium]
MPTVTVTGVVLRRWDVGEFDRRVSILTSERGRILATARGARKSASKLAGVTEPLSLSRFQIAIGRKKEYITQAQPIRAFPKIRKDFRFLSAALAWCEILDAILPVEEPNQEIFDLAVLVLDAIEESEEPLAPLSWGDLHLMTISGYAPEFRTCVVTGQECRGAKRYLSPRSGGAVASPTLAEDAFEVPYEVAITLAQLLELPNPPRYMKRAREVAAAILPFWLEIVGHRLPARQNLLSNSMTNSTKL